jgi:FMNH2-dependent dimethyl sulfone monooxygenase
MNMPMNVSEPKPVGRTTPFIINAGQSDAGRAFAMRCCNGFFTNFREAGVEKATAFVEAFKAEARSKGRDIDVYTQGHVVCRPTRKEAEEYFRYVTTEGADYEAVEEILRLKNVTRENTPDFDQRVKALPPNNVGYAIIGSPDDVAEKFARIHGAGISGIAFSLVNYVLELPFLIQEVLPRLERMGLRTATS